MRKGLVLALVVALALALVMTWSPVVWAQKSSCNNIQSGLITTEVGTIETVTTGYDQWGYNYQAHMFNGRYCDFRRGESGWWDAYCDDDLIMKWSDEWISNLDCDDGNSGIPNGKLDRGLDKSTLTSDGLSKGWLTNHQAGSYINDDGRKCKWTYFVKIVFVGPAPTVGDDPWEGYRIWGQYARIQSVYNDQCEGYHGIEFKPIVPPGFGHYTNQ
jgi:hypothetical protein